MELKKCPFCGGDAELTFSGHEYANGTCRGYIIVRCTMCGGAGKGFFYRGDSILSPLEGTVGGEKAASAWNRRVKCQTES